MWSYRNLPEPSKDPFRNRNSTDNQMKTKELGKILNSPCYNS